MKRIKVAFAMALALALMMTGCSRGCSRTQPSTAVEQTASYAQDFIGSWELIGMVQDGEETAKEDLDDLRSRGIVSYLDLMEDSTASLELFSTAMNGTWEASAQGSGTLTIEDQPIAMALDGESLVLTQDTSELTFRQIDPADKVEPQDIASTFMSGGESTYYGGNTIDELEDVREIDVTVADDDICAIKAVAVGMYEGDPGILFEIVNNTDKDILISDNYTDWSVDGTYQLVTLYETVRTGETLGTIAWFSADDVGTSADSILNTSGTVYVLDAQDISQEITHYDFTL